MSVVVSSLLNKSDLLKTVKAFVGEKELTASLMAETVSHLVENLKDSGLNELEKSKLVLTTLLQHVATPSVRSCVSVLSNVWVYVKKFLLFQKVQGTTPLDLRVPVSVPVPVPQESSEPEAVKA